jgi:hypothetical protein
MPTVYPDLSAVRVFQSRGRTTHTHLLEALQGSVYKNEANEWKRLLPARDPYYEFCFCNEARIDHVDPEKQSISVSPELDFDIVRPNVGDAPKDNHNSWMTAVNSQRDTPAGGCFITASYRPLITAFKPPAVDLKPNEPGWHAAKNDNDSPAFDWLDPQWNPTVHTLPWPTGFTFVHLKPFGFPDNLPLDAKIAQPMAMPVVEFSIRRMLVGEPPWDLIEKLANTVNQADFPSILNTNLPTCKKGTLRFDNMEVLEHYSSLVPGQMWFEIVYHFSWLVMTDSPVYDENGIIDPEGTITWNHVFMNVEAIDASIPRDIPAGLQWRVVSKLGTDWIPFVPGVGQKQLGPLYSFANFGPLFEL